MKKIFVAASIFTISTLTIAETKTIDNANVTVIVYRPIDQWIPDTKRSDELLGAINDKSFGFAVLGKDGSVDHGTPSPFQKSSDLPAIKQARSILLSKKANLTFRENANRYTITQAQKYQPSSIEYLANSERGLFRQYVLSQGNPAELSEKKDIERTKGIVAGLGAVAVGFFAKGLNGANAVLGSGTVTDFEQMFTSTHEYSAPANLPAINMSEFAETEVRKVLTTIPGVVGQIIIGYKINKTSEFEAEALAQAIVSLSGIDSTESEIIDSRNKDLDNRQKIWDEWVSQGKPAVKKDGLMDW